MAFEVAAQRVELPHQLACLPAVMRGLTLVSAGSGVERLCRNHGCGACSAHPYAVWTISFPKPRVSSSSAWKRTASDAGPLFEKTGAGDAAS